MIDAIVMRRIEKKISPEPNSGCWLWTGCITSHGYANINIGGRYFRVHRILHEHYYGPVPRELVMDHKCRVRSCVNPDHVEPVTQRVNTLRGEQAQRTHCPHGHEYTEDNIRWAPTRHGGVARECLTCLIKRWRNSSRRRRAEKRLRGENHGKA